MKKQRKSQSEREQKKEGKYRDRKKYGGKKDLTHVFQAGNDCLTPMYPSKRDEYRRYW